jgi:hypothetical protein
MIYYIIEHEITEKQIIGVVIKCTSQLELRPFIIIRVLFLYTPIIS